MKKLALNNLHESLGAKMVPFAGYSMPIQYEGLLAEHKAVRTDVGVFDVSHMGEIWIKGENAIKLIQKITSNDASLLYDGKVQYSCFPNGKGGIVDDLLVYRFSEEEYLLVVNASNIEKDWDWIKQQNTFEAELINESEEISEIAIQGPKSEKVLQKLTDFNLSEMEHYCCKRLTVAGLEKIIVSSTGYTGEEGFELYFPNNQAETIWKAIMKAGEEFSIKPIGLGARDTLRLEKGYTLYGNDIDDTTSSIEAGLGWITKFPEGKEFIDKDILLKQKQEGTSRKLVGFKLLERGIPRQHYKIVNANGNEIGEVTSGTMSPNLNAAIGMGYVKTEYSKIGTEIYIQIRNKQIKAEVVKRPFL